MQAKGTATSAHAFNRLWDIASFWNQVTFFVSKDENLTKAHIRHLEGKLLEAAKSAGRAVVTNTQSSGSRLPESDRGEMEVFLEKINQLLPVLGVAALADSRGDCKDGRHRVRSIDRDSKR